MEDPAIIATRKSVHDKIVRYLFNQHNRKGWAKGRWFISALGFDPNNPEHVDNLAGQINFNPATARFQKSSGGIPVQTRSHFVGTEWKDHNAVRTIWQKQQSSSIMVLLTIMPPKRKDST